MTLVGTGYLVYLPTPALREVLRRFDDPDDYGVIYLVTHTSHPRRVDPSRVELDAAHWTMFSALVDEFEGVNAWCEERGFDACWTVHQLDVKSAKDALEDALWLKAKRTQVGLPD